MKDKSHVFRVRLGLYTQARHLEKKAATSTVTIKFRPYWASLGKDGGYLPAELLKITTQEVEADYLARGYSLTKVDKPCGMPKGVSGSKPSVFTFNPWGYGTKGLQRLHVPDDHGGYVSGTCWPDSTHHPEVLRALWPGDFPERRGRRQRGKSAPASVVDALIAAAAAGANMSRRNLLALGCRKPRANEREAKDLLELMLAIADASGVSRQSLIERTGYSKQQMSAIVDRNRHRIPPWTAVDDEQVVEILAEFSLTRIEPLTSEARSTATLYGSIPGGHGRIRRSKGRRPLRGKATVRKTQVCGRGVLVAVPTAPFHSPDLEDQHLHELALEIRRMREDLNTLRREQREGLSRVIKTIKKRYPDDVEIARAVDEFVSVALLQEAA